MSLVAGAAAVDISPPTGVQLAGYPHVERLSTGTHDPLLASIVYLDAGGSSLVVGSLDLLMLDPSVARSLRRALSDDVGVPEDRVFVACTHTHSGPVTTPRLIAGDGAPDGEYLASVQEGARRAAREARRTARPAELAWTAATIDGVGCNRHDPDGPRDAEAGVLVVRDASTQSLVALASVYSMHPTVLHEDSTLVSADFPGYARAHLQEAYSGDCPVLYLMGPSGNQSPRYHVRGQTFAEAERLGRTMGAAVAAAVDGLPDDAFARDPVLAGAMTTITLSPRAVPSVEEAERELRARRERFQALRDGGAPHGPVRTAECSVFGGESTVALAKLARDGTLAALVEEHGTPDVQCVRIGEATLAGLPGEFFVEYGLRIKEAARPRTFPVTLVNGHTRGYIVTPEAAREGGYESANSLFSHESGPDIVAKAVELVERLA